MNSSSHLRLFLLLFSGVFALFFGGREALVFYQTRVFQKQVPAHVFRWEIEEISADQFSLLAKYTYQFEDKNYEGLDTFPKPYYLNESSAIAAVKENVRHEWQAWVDPKKPSHSTLHKNTPSLFKAFLPLFVFIYFMFKKYDK